MNAERATVLFVDDEERILRSLRMLFRGRHDVLTATSGSEALQIVHGRSVHVIVSDQRMPEITGVELLQRVRSASPATMRVLLTGYADLPSIVASVNDGEIFRFVEKPWHPQRLLDTVEQAAQIALPEFVVGPLERLRAANGIDADRWQRDLAPATRQKLLVLDEDRETFALVCEVDAGAHAVLHAADVESALALLGEEDVAVVIAELRNRHDDVVGALKTLKRYTPATLTIAVSLLHDARMLIELINQGQIFRFLPKPLSRELLRRALHSAFEHHAHTRATPSLLRRHAVEEARFEPMSISARLIDYWRRIRDNGRARLST